VTELLRLRLILRRVRLPLTQWFSRVTLLVRGSLAFYNPSNNAGMPWYGNNRCRGSDPPVRAVVVFNQQLNPEVRNPEVRNIDLHFGNFQEH
jgi:hypothetical protein